MQQLQVQVSSVAVADLDDDALEAWRAFLTAPGRVARRISRDLADAGLPDLSWYDLLWALYTTPDRRLRVNELAREVVGIPTAMSRFVDRVEAAGHARRGRDAAGGPREWRRPRPARRGPARPECFAGRDHRFRGCKSHPYDHQS